MLLNNKAATRGFVQNSQRRKEFFGERKAREAREDTHHHKSSTNPRNLFVSPQKRS